jgi:hypothetical protein
MKLRGGSMPVYEVVVKRTMVLESSVLIEANTSQDAVREVLVMNRDRYLGYIKWEPVDSHFTWKCTKSKIAIRAIEDITDRIEEV